MDTRETYWQHQGVARILLFGEFEGHPGGPEGLHRDIHHHRV
ncbi:hypothetical protein I551_3194 [Mycobacterium ulcerans str. Harvey]|uniref:Uncharacterized protein n=1 Tax=Mycobacterium ulcerans str. Harvey TaxID=1299332 RepID=A0ABN0R0C3_MYCUL|nr:hypothetical protein I551_3194 [Mycobacterium ulcerans str. Harvey]